MSHRVLRLRNRPVGKVANTDLELVTEPKPEAGKNELLVKNLFISMDPTHYIWMSDRKQYAFHSYRPFLTSFLTKRYMPPVGLGEIMRAVTVGIVEVSNNDAFPVGCHVVGFGGVAEYYIGIPGLKMNMN